MQSLGTRKQVGTSRGAYGIAKAKQEVEAARSLDGAKGPLGHGSGVGDQICWNFYELEGG